MLSVRALYQKGGPNQRAAEQVNALVGRISSGETQPFHGMRLTKHGERRIEKCVKYDLTDRARLITIIDGGLCLLCFAGTHPDAEVWIERNRGLKVMIDQTGEVRVIETVRSSSDSDPGVRLTGKSDLAKGMLYERIPEALFDRLVDGLPRGLIRLLESFESIVEEEQIFDLVCQIEGREIQRDAVFDTFTLLRQGALDAAVQRVRQYLGELEPVANVDEDELATFKDGKALASMPTDSPQYQQLFEHFMRTADYREWMLFLHPDQEAVAYRDFTGSAKLSGVSGSGKTCIVVKRAVFLAEKYPDQRVLVLTLNRPLAKLISELVLACTPNDVSQRIDVEPFFHVCQRLLMEFEPGSEKLYDDRTWKSHEHIDEIWREFYRCELRHRGAEKLQSVHDSLLSRGVEAESYIRDEFDWIRSAVAASSRQEYLEIARKGRAYPIDRERRGDLLEGLSEWERKMRFVGVTDYLGIATALYAYIERIRPEYTCILVDESQDFGTTELRIIRRLVTEGPDDLFLTGDAAQHVSVKHQSLKQAGINIPPAYSLSIRKNYRNTRSILKTANQMVENHLSEEMLENEDFELLNPEYAELEGAPVLCLRAKDVAQELAAGLSYARELVSASQTAKCCVVICGWSLYETQKFGKQQSLPVLDGTVSLESGDIFLSDLEQTKGFEFDAVIIVNLNNDVLPNRMLPEKEQFRDLSRLFVAMTRAKTELALSWSSEKSEFLENISDHVLEGGWDEQVSLESMVEVGLPPRLDDLRSENIPMCDLGEMTGEQFLYTAHAVGLSPELVAKLRENITGRKRTEKQHGGENVTTHWQNIGAALHDTLRLPASRRIFGRVVVREFHDMARQIGLIGKNEGLRLD